MILPRAMKLILLTSAGFALLTTSAAGQDALPAKNNTAFAAVTEARDGRGIPKDKAAELKPHFDAFAKYYADFVSHPLVYRILQDPSTKLPNNVTLQALNLDERIKELDSRLLEPHPLVRANSEATTPKVNAENADYIRELGVSLDAAFKPLIERHPEQIVRVNAARVYAVICRTGAPAHWPTVTTLLTNQNTPTEVRYYILQAAGNLLSAYDVYDYKSRRHAIGSKQPPAAADKEIGALVKAVEDHVNNPNLILPGLPEGKVEKASLDQQEVIQFVRRQAIRALGQVRFWRLPGPSGDLYPVHTLARVCMADPTLLPAPSPSECAEAVIGICNMAPMWNAAVVKGYNADAIAEAVASGVINFASLRSAKAEDRSIAWRSYSSRIIDAFKSWKPLFDPLLDPTNPNKADLTAPTLPQVITDVTKRAQENVLDQIMKVDAAGKPDIAAQVNVIALRDYLKTLQENPKRTGVLIAGVPQTALPALPKK